MSVGAHPYVCIYTYPIHTRLTALSSSPAQIICQSVLSFTNFTQRLIVTILCDVHIQTCIHTYLAYCRTPLVASFFYTYVHTYTHACIHRMIHTYILGILQETGSGHNFFFTADRKYLVASISQSEANTLIKVVYVCMYVYTYVCMYVVSISQSEANTLIKVVYVCMYVCMYVCSEHKSI